MKKVLFLMNNFTIVQDTREQENKQDHVLKYFEEKGINVVRTKLYVGDYSLLNDMSVCVDRKKDLLEVANNLSNSKNHQRVREEMIRAKEHNIKLYILIEDEYIYNLEGVKYYKVPTYKGNQYKDGKIIHKRGEKRTKVNFETLSKAMKTMEEKYGVTFVFSNHNDFGKKILHLLGVGVD